jgi:hypothetical protein
VNPWYGPAHVEAGRTNLFDHDRRQIIHVARSPKKGIFICTRAILLSVGSHP